MSHELDELRDIFLGYLATVESRVHALELILERKGIIVSREEIENAQQELGNPVFNAYVWGYDKLLPEIRSRMRDLRDR